MFVFGGHAYLTYRAGSEGRATRPSIYIYIIVKSPTQPGGGQIQRLADGPPGPDHSPPRGQQVSGPFTWSYSG